MTPRYDSDSLRKDQYVIEIPEDIRKRAAYIVERMIAIGQPMKKESL